MEWCTGNLKVTAAVLGLFITMSGTVRLNDCQGGFIYITNDTSSPSTIKCSGVATDSTVTWIIVQNSVGDIVAECPNAACTPKIPGVEAQRFVDSGISILKITHNHQQVAGGGAVVSCLASNGSSATCTIGIIEKLPSVTNTVANYPLYVGERADLRCKTSPAESLPSFPVTYTWAWSSGGEISCIYDVTVPSYHCLFYVTSQHNKAGVTCELSYRDYSNIPGKTSVVTLNVKFPPPQAPVITGNREVSVGETLTLECRVYSGNPLVTSVSFYCGNYADAADYFVKSDTDDTSYVSSNITIQSVQTSDNGVMCQCGGTWEKHDFYAGKSIVTLNVTGTGTAQPPVTSAITVQSPSTTTGSHGNTNGPEITTSTTTVNPAITPLTSTVTDANTGKQSDNPPNTAAVAGGVVAAIVVIAVVVVVVIIKRRNSRPKPPPTSARDPLYDTEEHINPVYGTDDPSPNHNDIYGGGGDEEIPDMGYSAVGTRAHNPTTKPTAMLYGGSSAAGDEYAVVDKSKKPKKNGAHAQNPQNTEYAVVNKPRKNQPPAQSQDEYAVVDKSRKNQPPAPSQDEYAVVDKARKKPAAKPKPGAKPKPNAAATPTDDEYNSLSFQQSAHAPQQSRDVEQDYSHLADLRSDADR